MLLKDEVKAGPRIYKPEEKTAAVKDESSKSKPKIAVPKPGTSFYLTID